ncbi:putative NADPH-dependent methylglyoxal reductase GRP2 [Candida viswanathii]|uniref:Putative NADPH-dependent methylglyoxal reductase GRP2 n=1 Tax=Candida viswanathii TaxID=5486 RepID=A0A367XM83_9ASCO|nr:putative NADPH-dependent methylglyoxal reductase GRP2 [Candida viswanathii]
MSSPTTSVFVSGASGYIAQELVKQLIQKGYKVVGTVRSTTKGDSLKSNLSTAGLASGNFSYEVVPDIAVKGAFDAALQAHPEVTVFLHTASPFHFDVQDVETELLLPAIEGTTNALSAIKTHGPQVKHVVVTSSFAAVGAFFELADPSKSKSEEDWNPITYDQAKSNAVNGYVGSKTFAEKAAWEFQRTEKPKFTLSTVNPVYVFGPQAFEIRDKSQLNTSAEIVNSVLKLSKDDKIEQNMTGYFIDVRDVARAHIVAFEKREIDGKRLILADAPFSTQKVLDIVRDDFPKLAEKLPEGDPAKADEWKNTESEIKNEKTRELLGFEFIDLKTSIDDTVSQIIA